MIKKLILLCSVFISCLSFAEETPQNTRDQKTAELFARGQQLIAGGTDGLVNQAENYVNSEGVGVTKSFLEKYFPTVEVSFDMFSFSKESV